MAEAGRGRGGWEVRRLVAGGREARHGVVTREHAVQIPPEDVLSPLLVRRGLIARASPPDERMRAAQPAQPLRADCECGPLRFCRPRAVPDDGMQVALPRAAVEHIDPFADRSVVGPRRFSAQSVLR